MKQIKCLVLKVGSSSLVGEDGSIHQDFIDRLAKELKALKSAGWEIIIVSSGAIALGRILYGRPIRKSLSQKQALSAIGQRHLINLWEGALSKSDIMTAQILLTRDDFKSRKRMLNFRNVLTELIKMGTIPIINENDALSSDEIRVGDNDTLGALVAVAAGATDYVIMSDIDGLYDKNPAKYTDCKIIPTVTVITADIRKMAGLSGSKIGTGGMITKLDSAEIVTKAGITMHIVTHQLDNFARKLSHQEAMGTEFAPRKNISGHRHWIGFQSSPVGQLTIDEGAFAAIRSHKSLLAVGITQASGYFKPGDTVEIQAPDGKLVGKGLSNFSSTQIRLIMGKKNSLHKDILKEDVHTSVVHADNMLINEEDK